MEAERVCNGNGIAWIQRDPRSLKPTALFPIPSGFWTVQQLSDGSLRYTVQHPFENRSIVCGEMDVLHVMAFTKNGYRGIGYLERAQEIVRTAKAAQDRPDGKGRAGIQRELLPQRRTAGGDPAHRVGSLRHRDRHRRGRHAADYLQEGPHA